MSTRQKMYDKVSALASPLAEMILSADQVGRIDQDLANDLAGELLELQRVFTRLLLRRPCPRGCGRRERKRLGVLLRSLEQPSQ